MKIDLKNHLYILRTNGYSVENFFKFIHVSVHGCLSDFFRDVFFPEDMIPEYEAKQTVLIISIQLI